jgi:hypothetical protein
MRSHKLMVSQRVRFSQDSALSASVGGELVILHLLSVGVNGPEYRVHKDGEPFDRVVAQNELVACA